MKLYKWALIAHTATLLFSVSANAAEKSNSDRIRLLDAIHCRLDFATYSQFAMSISETDQALIRKLGWKKMKSPTPFMHEYQLPTPIKVADSYSTRTIGFTASAIVAILDLADTQTLADKEGIKNEMDSEFIRQLNGGFRRFMGGRVLAEKTEPFGERNLSMRITISRQISNFQDFPGKTLYGCSYQMDVLDENGKPL